MKVQSILFPTDFSELSQAAEQSACDLADRFGAELHVLHVLSDVFLTMPQTAAALFISPDALEGEIAGAEEAIQKVPPSAWASGKKVVRTVRIGSTYTTIVEYALANAIDLIVLGTHSHAGLKHALMGSVAERVVQHAHCSVLTVPCNIPAKIAEEVPQVAILQTA